MKLRGHTDNIRALLLDSTGRLVRSSLSFSFGQFLSIVLLKRSYHDNKFLESG